ncbi:MAG: hypothetical protein M3Q63_01275 [bacterium]|nr:hypothetical protein [bacterium]
MAEAKKDYNGESQALQDQARKDGTTHYNEFYGPLRRVHTYVALGILFGDILWQLLKA